MTDRQGEKERRTGRVRQFLRSVRTEMVFSGESLPVSYTHLTLPTKA